MLRGAEDEGWRTTRSHSWRTAPVALAPRAGAPPRAAAVAAVPGLVHVRGALSAAECRALRGAAEACGFDNAHHPAYQSEYIDKLEERFRRNDRLVYEASGAQCAALFARVAAALPQEIDARAEYTTDDADVSAAPPEEFGVWRPSTVNDMWRFYRYDPARQQEFPVHKDNVTVKQRGTEASWLSVLFYLSGGFEGGGTAFYAGPLGALRVAHEVEPREGDAVFFLHHGHRSPFHAGLPVTGGEGMKYVLRTDAMYRAAPPARTGPTRVLSAPYDDAIPSSSDASSPGGSFPPPPSSSDDDDDGDGDGAAPAAAAPGARVTVVRDFRSDSGRDVLLVAGQRGMVAELDGDGDALVDFDDLPSMHWVCRSSFANVAFADAAPPPARAPGA